MTISNWAYAALAEHIYRRNQQTDQAIREQDLAGEGGLQSNEVLQRFDDPLELAELGGFGFSVSEDVYIYNPATGFEAAVARGDNGEYVITFRGTDFLSSSQKDQGDVDANLDLGLGDVGLLTLGDVQAAQWSDVKNLTEFVIDQLAGGDASKVSVTGQSLGGGLAGLASAAFDVKDALLSRLRRIKIQSAVCRRELAAIQYVTGREVR